MRDAYTDATMRPLNLHPRLYTWRYIVGAMALFATVHCKKEAPPSVSELQQSALPSLTFDASAKALFTFFDAQKQQFATTSTMSEIPQPSLGWVRVVDLSQKPANRHDHELVYVADLRSPSKDGKFRPIVMSRRAFELSAQHRIGQGASDPPPTVEQGASTTDAKNGSGPSVILYSTSWCPACRAAKNYMQEQGISFVEKDIEKDAAAAQELMAKAKAAGVSTSGVPVLDVKGTLIQGFDVARLNALLGRS